MLLAWSIFVLRRAGLKEIMGWLNAILSCNLLPWSLCLLQAKTLCYCCCCHCCLWNCKIMVFFSLSNYFHISQKCSSIFFQIPYKLTQKLLFLLPGLKLVSKQEKRGLNFWNPQFIDLCHHNHLITLLMVLILYNCIVI